MLEPLGAKQNELMAALPDLVYRRVLPRLEAVRLTPGQRLLQESDNAKHIYFPLDGIVSVGCTLSSGATMAVGAVGRDGMLGVAMMLGAESCPFASTVQCESTAVRMALDTFRKEIALGDEFRYVMMRYALALFARLGYAGVCARFHTLEQQLSRWLLSCLDLLPTATVPMTHEQISHVLGCRREGVTEAVGKLQDAGLIIAGRGSITVIDRPSLAARACECHGLIRQTYKRFSSPPTLSASGDSLSTRESSRSGS